ncbi:MAG: aldo/keto reductase [Gammaproteobacteria bacterium]|nr:oxidoreductase [Gammaproteobacteria bacterium]
MRSAVFGPTGIDVPLIGQGTWNLEHDDPDEVIAALDAGLDAGMTHIDTAELYGNGRVEEMIAPLVRRRRDEIFLVSKVLPQNASYEGTREACERTLARLGTDHLDVYLLHWRGRVPLEETFRAFEALQEAGKIRAFGVSNFDVDDLEEAVNLVGEGRIACNQVLYHLNERSIETRVIPWCREHGVAVVAYSPFGSGRFPSLRTGGGRVLASIAERRNVSPRQVALAFLVQQGQVFAIPKAANIEHVLDNASAGDLELTRAEMRALDDAFPVKPRRDLPVL